MDLDKSKDYLVQNAVRTVWYLQKAAEGDATFNTSTVSTFKAAAKTVGYVVRNSTPLSAQEFLEGSTAEFYVWRTPWLVNLTGTPSLGDKLYADGRFWLVDSVDFTDMDGSGEYQRYKLSCTASKRTPT